MTAWSSLGGDSLQLCPCLWSPWHFCKALGRSNLCQLLSDVSGLDRDVDLVGDRKGYAAFHCVLSTLHAP